MIAVIQRVRQAEVTVSGRTAGKIGAGLCVLLGVAVGDTNADADFLADKIAGLRIFSDKDGKMNVSLKDVSGSALVVSQFTLCGDWRKGRRPGFTNAAAPDEGERLYRYFYSQLQGLGIPVETGEFGAMMDVSLINEGPVTFVLDSQKNE
ncbi:MAG: D-tyrosyl-tRNA(Tyr) deacylase [Candidatus Marinimicrobia bacterium]|nr:D-tyrosyl-tRNA(Tyr) deacylase [Candidatus Neomarinimicrobiota bacterium]